MTEQQDDRWPVVTGTAVRELDDWTWPAAELRRTARRLARHHDTRVGVSGMARGGDLAWAEAVLEAGLALWAFVPFPQQTDGWDPQERHRRRILLAQAAKVDFVGDLAHVPAHQRRAVAVRLLHQRNDAMLDECAAVVALLPSNVRSGGTFSCVDKVRRRGLPYVWLNPLDRSVKVARPAARSAVLW